MRAVKKEKKEKVRYERDREFKHFDVANYDYPERGKSVELHRCDACGNTRTCKPAHQRSTGRTFWFCKGCKEEGYYNHPECAWKKAERAQVR